MGRQACFPGSWCCQGEWSTHLKAMVRLSFQGLRIGWTYPYIVPMKWEDGWPVIGVNGKVPETLIFQEQGIDTRHRGFRRVQPKERRSGASSSVAVEPQSRQQPVVCNQEKRLPPAYHRAY